MVFLFSKRIECPCATTADEIEKLKTEMSETYYRRNQDGIDLGMMGRIGDYDVITVFSYIFSAPMYNMFLHSNGGIPLSFIFF